RPSPARGEGERRTSPLGSGGEESSSAIVIGTGAALNDNRRIEARRRRRAVRPRMDDGILAKVLRTLSSGADAAAPPNPACPPLPRPRGVVLREDWTEAEVRHAAACAACRRAVQLARAVAWHPPPAALFARARGRPVDHPEDLTYHLERDRCQRCRRLTD